MNSFAFRSILLSLLFLSACKKDKAFVANNTATLNVINGIVQKDILLNINGSINNSGADGYSVRQSRVFFGSNLFFYTEAKNTSINFLNKTDSTSLASRNFDLKKGGIYTVLLAGVAPNAEAVLIDDSKLPYVNLSKTPSDVDSVVNVRFINLVPDLPNVSVRIQGALTNEINSLAFKTASDWKTYPAKLANGFNISFEFVDNGVILGSESVFFYGSRFKNVALVLCGMKTPGPGQYGAFVSVMNYFQ